MSDLDAAVRAVLKVVVAEIPRQAAPGPVEALAKALRSFLRDPTLPRWVRLQQVHILMITALLGFRPAFQVAWERLRKAMAS